MKRHSYNTGLIILTIIFLFIVFITLNDAVGFLLIEIVLGVAGITLLYSLIGQFKNAYIRPAHRLRSKEFSLKFTATLMGFFLVLGTILYFYVFYNISQSESVTYTLRNNDDQHLNVQFNNTEYLLRSLICSLDLFMLDVDSNILDRLDDKPLIKVWISIQAVLSFSCTVLMLVGLVYSRLNAYYKLTYRTKIDNSHNHLYLFFGINEPSETLIKDIVRNDPNAVIILVDEANVKEDDTNEWEGIVGFATHNHKTFDAAEKYSIRVAIAGKALNKIDDEITALPDFDAFGYLGLSRIAKLIGKLKVVDKAQLHLFFLDENEEKNIRDIMVLAKDRTIMSIAGSQVQHQIYCHARYNGPNRVIEDVAVKKNLNIKIVDSSHLAIERLKLHGEFHPYNVVEMDADNPGTVKGSFDSLIVGFGEVGRDAFRFLYEFAAFIDNSATLTNAKRCQFNCTIVDKDIANLEGPFKASMPGIFNDENSKSCIKFESIDYNQEKFYDELLNEKTIANLNYVVISIGDNDEAISLATRIFNRFRQYDGDLSKLLILVRCTDDSKVEAIRKIADHYNYGYGKGLANKPVIRVFGQPAETYTYQLIISNQLVELGKRFHESYRKIKQEGESWEDRHNSFTRTAIPNIDKLRKMRRQESQDLANALHVLTKMAFLGAAMPEPFDWTGFFVRYFKNEDSPNRIDHKANITYPRLSSQENLIVLRLAMLEHLRWNAAHELLGYVRRDDGVAACDERSLRHNCLKNWDELDAESELTESSDWPCDYKEYDFAVVDTTIALSYKEKFKQND